MWILFLLVCIAPLQADNWYSEYWQKLFWTHWENDTFAIGTFVRLDSRNHMRGCRGGQISEQFAWKVSEDFRLEAHYTYLHDQSIVPDSPWRWQNRIELEGNRTFHLFCNWELRTRNRLEIRWLENESDPHYRIRQLTMLYAPIENASLTAYSFYNELFYDMTLGRVTQDRIYPIQLTFALSEKVDFEAFFMVRFLLHDDYWVRSAVLGTQFLF